MPRLLVLVLALTASLAAAPALAQSMTVGTFLRTAEPIPRNATSLVRSDTRRLIGEVRRSIEQIKAEQAEAQRIGARPAHCIPASGASISAETLMARFEAIPPGRRHITVVAAMREWMAERYPCPA